MFLGLLNFFEIGRVSDSFLEFRVLSLISEAPLELGRVSHLCWDVAVSFRFLKLLWKFGFRFIFGM